MAMKEWKKKELATIVAAADMKTSEFSVKDEGRNFIITSKAVRMSFTITGSGDTYNCFSAYIDESEPPHLIVTWENVKYYLQEWLKEVRKEIEAGDSWNEDENNFLHVDEDDINAKFTLSEVKEVQASIRRLMAEIPKIELWAEQVAVINAKLDQLYEKAANSNKFDWKSQFVGTIANLIIFLALPPDKAGTLWDMAREAFKGLLQISSN
jgi:hypothetical protein